MEFEPYENKLSFRNKLGRLCWNIAYTLFFRPFGLPHLNFYRAGILRLFGATVGKNCVISSKIKIWAPWNLVMGDRCVIGFDALLYNPGMIILGNKTTISQRAHLCSASHDFNSIHHELITAPIHVQDRAWVASDAFVGMGVTIGEGAVVGARACVYKDVEAWQVVGGNPARFIKKRKLDLSSLPGQYDAEHISSNVT